ATTASKRPERAAAWAASGSSKAPGASISWSESASAPASSRARRAPSTRPATTWRLNAERTSATRSPRADIRSLGACFTPGSLALELRGTLLEERAGSLGLVLAGADQAEQRCLEQQPLGQRQLVAGAHGLQREAQRQRAVGEHLAQQRLGLGQQPLARDHLVDEADAVRLGGVDHLARRQQLERAAAAHQPR